MGFYHTIEQGDDLPKIADEYGFKDYNTIWQASENESLRQKRQPTVLMPGDRVFVPDKKAGEVSVEVGAKHRFQVKVAVPRLRLLLTGFDDRPLANSACKLTVGGNTRDLTTDGQGVLACPLPADAEEATLIVGEREIALKIGHLDPVDERSGLLDRLRNLGYLEPLADGDTDGVVSDADLAFGVACFQRVFGLAVDGDAKAIVDKLKEIYGC